MQFSSFLNFSPCTDGKCLHIVFVWQILSERNSSNMLYDNTIGIINSWEGEDTYTEATKLF